MTTLDVAPPARREPKPDPHPADDLPPVGPVYKWAVVGMLWFVCFLNYADRMAISSALPILEQDYGFNKEQLGLISSAFMWVYALSAPVAGQVVDLYSRKIAHPRRAFCLELVTGLTAFCTKVWQFVYRAWLRRAGRDVLFSGLDVADQRLPRAAHALTGDEYCIRRASTPERLPAASEPRG